MVKMAAMAMGGGSQWPGSGVLWCVLRQRPVVMATEMTAEMIAAEAVSTHVGRPT